MLSEDYRCFSVSPFAPNLGAEITDLDLSKGLSDDQFKEVHRAFLAFQVLFFKCQNEIPPQVHIEIGKKFGQLHAHPAAPTMPGFPEIFEIYADKNSKIANGEFWHSDVSCDEQPPLGTMLQLHTLPTCGGDTMFSDMVAAYETLSQPMKTFLDGLSAQHESEHIYENRYADRGKQNNEIDCPISTHPVVRTHPETGRKALYVNRTFTTKINDLTEDESVALLTYLFDHCEKIDFQIRFRWEKNDMAFWDNRCCMHRAIWDYWPQTRKGRRVTIKGDRPS